MGTSFTTLMLAALVALVPAPRQDGDDASADTIVFETPITYAAGGQLYIDAGTNDALAVGSEGVVRRGEAEIARVRIQSASSSSASLEIVRRFAAEGPRVGDRVVFRIAKPVEPEREPPGGTTRPAKDDEPFVPLLAETEPLAARTATSNVFHGYLEFGASANLSDIDDRDESRFRIGTGGSLDRIGGTAWSAEWDLDWYQRGGDDTDDPTDGELEVDLFVLRYHFGDDGVVGLGRIQPLALPSIGRIDGVYGEVRATQGLRFGIVGGTRPDVEDQGFSSDEYAVAPYAVFETGSYEDVRFWTSAGFLATWYDGESDRHALLLDARVDLAKRYVVRVTSEVDFYDSDDTRSGTRVTRLGAYASADLHDLFQPYVDVRDIELPETLARRSIRVDPDEPFDDGYRQTRVGLRHELGHGWSLEESVARTDADDFDDDPTFRVRAAKSGLFGLRGSRADLSVYEILGVDSDGIGASGSVSLMPAESLWMRLGYVHSEIDNDTAGSPSFSTKTATLDFDWFVTNDLSLGSRLAHSFGEDDDASVLDVSLTWRW